MSLFGDIPRWERAEREAYQYNLDASERQGGEREVVRRYNSEEFNRRYLEATRKHQIEVDAAYAAKQKETR